MRAILTGASSGIGLALARELSCRGYELALLARRAELLKELASNLTTKAIALACDVTDRESVRNAVQRAHDELGGAFDVAIANAGVGISGQVAKLRIDDAEQTIRVNVLGMLYFFDAVIPPMIEAKKGRFVGVASLAGLRGLPSSATYSASKAAMQTFLEASRVELKPYGVGVTIVNPGFVKSPMTDKNRFHMPFLMSAEKAARIIADGIERGKRVVEFPLPMALLVRLLRHLPDALYDRVMARGRG